VAAALDYIDAVSELLDWLPGSLVPARVAVRVRHRALDSAPKVRTAEPESDCRHGGCH
jgi:hypothetical protein